MDKQNNNENMPKMPKFNMNWIYALILISLVVVFFTGGNSLSSSSISVTKDYTAFMNYVEKGYAQRVVVNKKMSTLRMYVRAQHIRDVFNEGTKNTGRTLRKGRDRFC